MYHHGFRLTGITENLDPDGPSPKEAPNPIITGVKSVVARATINEEDLVPVKKESVEEKQRRLTNENLASVFGGPPAEKPKAPTLPRRPWELETEPVSSPIGKRIFYLAHPLSDPELEELQQMMIGRLEVLATQGPHASREQIANQEAYLLRAVDEFRNRWNNPNVTS